MDGNIRSRQSLESKYELLYRLMVIAAIAVILVSLVGIASVTGLLARVGDGKPDIEMRGNDAERPNRMQPGTTQSTPVPPQAALNVAGLRALPSDGTPHCGAGFGYRSEHKRNCPWR